MTEKLDLLDRLFPVKYCEGLTGLGSFILNLIEHPGDDPETDAENTAIAIVVAAGLEDIL